MNLKFRLKVWGNRIGTLRKDILIPGIVFLTSILLIELKLKYIPADSNLQYDLGQIYLKICYSFSSATIFYFIVVHLPKERRKVKSYRYINNKSLEIDREIRFLIDTINKVNGLNLDTRKSEQRDFDEAFLLINPQKSFLYSIESNIPFNDWFEYLKFKGDKIRRIINELLLLNETIDPDYLQSLTFITDEISKTMNFERQKWGNTDLTTWSHTIHDIVKYNNEMTEIMRKKYHRYSIEYHEEYRNKRKRIASAQQKL